MSDVFITPVVAIQPSASVQPESSGERDQLSQPQSSGMIKLGLYGNRRKRGVTHGVLSKPPRVRQGHALDPNTIVLWRFDETGTTIDLVSATGNPMHTLNRGNATLVNGKISNGLEFKNADFVSSMARESYLGWDFWADNWTYEGWFCRTGLHPSGTSYLYLCGSWYAWMDSVFLVLAYTNTTTLTGEWRKKGGGKVGWDSGLSPTVFALNDWTHFAIRKTVTNRTGSSDDWVVRLDFFINGASRTSVANLPNVSYTGSAYHTLGSWNQYGGYNYIGIMDDIRISKVARTDSEILDSYLNGVA